MLEHMMCLFIIMGYTEATSHQKNQIYQKYRQIEGFEDFKCSFLSCFIRNSKITFYNLLLILHIALNKEKIFLTQAGFEPTTLQVSQTTDF